MGEKPKIIVCATAYRPYVGGAEVAIEEVARRLWRHFDFYIVTARMSRRLPVYEKVQEGVIIRIGFGMRLDKWLLPFLATRRVRKIIAGFQKKDRVLLWGMDISQGSLAALMAGWRMPRLPFVLTVQYGESEGYLQSGRLGFIRRAFRAMLMRADAVTAISTYLGDLARAHGFFGLYTIIPNGVDFAHFSAEGASGILPDKKVVITISRLVHKNGIDILIRAIAEVRKTIPDVVCHIMGDGPEREKLEALARTLGVAGCVVFFGTVPHEDLVKHLRAAAVFVRPSRSEGMGNAFVEAAAVGVPIIGTRVGGIPDIIEDGRAGLFAVIDDPVDCAEKIVRILRDHSYGQMLAVGAKGKIAVRFGWDTIAEQYRGVFVQVLGAEKRVTIATGLFPPDIGGPATYVKSLVDALPRQGVGVRVAYFGAVRHWPRIMRHVAYMVRLAITARGSDVIFAQDPVSVGLPAAVVARALRTRFILKVVGDYAWEQERVKQGSLFETPEAFQKHRYGFMTEARRSVQRFVARQADRIITPSDYLRRLVTDWGIAGETITVVYNAYMLSMPLSRDEARRRLGLSGMVVISVGRLVPWKGFSMLIDAVADMMSEAPELCLAIAGSGPEEANLRRKVQERGVGARIRLLGVISHQALMSYLAASDVFVLNSGYEGFSHTLLEAMAAGLPVVATRVGGNPELITDGKEGRLITYNNMQELKDAILTLIRDPAARSSFGTRARVRAGAFTMEKMTEKTAAILRTL